MKSYPFLFGRAKQVSFFLPVILAELTKKCLIKRLGPARSPVRPPVRPGPRSGGPVPGPAARSPVRRPGGPGASGGSGGSGGPGLGGPSPRRRSGPAGRVAPASPPAPPRPTFGDHQGLRKGRLNFTAHPMAGAPKKIGRETK